MEMVTGKKKKNSEMVYSAFEISPQNLKCVRH